MDARKPYLIDYKEVSIMRSKTISLFAPYFLLFSLLFSVSAIADNKPVYEVIHETDSPFGGDFGIYGWDVSERQSVAMQFTPTDDYLLTNIAVWFMNNASRHRGDITLSVCESRELDDGSFLPDEKKCDSWDFRTPPLPMFIPFLISIPIDLQEKQIPVEKGKRYWIMAESDDEPLPNAVWVTAANDLGIMTNTDRGEWNTAGQGATTTAIIEGVRRDSSEQSNI